MRNVETDACGDVSIVDAGAADRGANMILVMTHCETVS
jgi:hypothetical protein